MLPTLLETTTIYYKEKLLIIFYLITFEKYKISKYNIKLNVR